MTFFGGNSAQEVEQGVGLTSRLSCSQIKDYLSKVDTIPRDQLVKDIESIGFKLKGGSKDGKFMEFIDKNTNVRIKIHPHDNVGTDYSHIHLYDSVGNPFDAQLQRVSYKSFDAHIKISELTNHSSLFNGTGL